MIIEDVIKFYDDYLDHLAIKNVRHDNIFRSLDAFIPKEVRVLDIGCGTGITSKHLADGGRDVVAVDLSPVLIDFAIKHNTAHTVLQSTYLNQKRQL